MQFFGIEDIKDLTKASQTTIEWEAGSSLRIGGQAYSVTSVLTLNTATDIDTGAITNDTIYYVYAVVVAGTVSLKYSLSSSAPTGFTAYRKIGSFRSDDISEIAGTSVKDQGKVGDIIHSMLSEENFIAENGAGWVLARGQTVVGSKYAALIGPSVPDLRGQFLRGKDHGRHLIDGKGNPDGDLGLGTYNEDAIRNIVGEIYYPASSTTVQFLSDSTLTTGTGAMNISRTGTSNSIENATGSGTFPRGFDFNASRVVPTAADNRPKNTTVNIFIKIDDIAI